MSNAAVEAIEARMSALTAPIPGPTPTGDDLAFDPEFEQIKAETDKIGHVSNIPPDWAKVATLSGRLLSRTKDMRVVIWFAAARMNQTGWAGLAEGLVVLRTMVVQHWDGMHPERRPRARANIFAWLTEQVVATLGVLNAPAPERPAVLACEALFKELDAALNDKLGELHPGMGTVRSLIASSLSSAPEPAAPPPKVEAPAATTTAGPRAAPVAAGSSPALAAPVLPSVGAAEDVAPAVSKCGETILAAASLLRGKNHADAWAYALQRAGIWLGVRGLPPSEASKTFIPPPPARMRQDLEAHSATGRWLPLLNEAEAATSTYLFWLDLHRYVAVALQNLGAECEEAARLVRGAAFAFVARFPAIPMLSFKDGTPFASAPTQAWIGEGQGGGQQDALSEQRAEDDKKLAAARREVAGGRVGEGVGLLVELARRAPEGRARFDMELEAARMALDAKKATLARPILEGLVSQIEAHGLDAWEPSRCVPVYAALLTAIRATNSAKVDSTHREASIIDKLCRLDPALAVRLGV